jgi:nucleotide-binding universal stress UspA family protein
MKKILIATDFSEYADYAIQSAASISHQTGAKLILLHVIDRPLDKDDDSYVNYHNMPGYNNVITNIQKKMDAVVTKLKLIGVKIVYELSNDVFQTIIKHADLNKVDLIVMGAYGKGGSSESYIGANTEKVMLHAKMPVMIVKEQFKEFYVENMVFASEFYGDVYKVFPKMKKIIDLFGPKIHLLKVNTPSQFQRTHDTLKLMSEFSTEFGIDYCTQNIYNDLTIEDGILNFTKLIDADLIAITPDGFWRLSHVFNKNITDELMKKSVKVVLSMKTHQPVPTPTDFFFTEDYKRFSIKQ